MFGAGTQKRSGGRRAKKKLCAVNLVPLKQFLSNCMLLTPIALY
jgi:hypothetical protein